MKQNPFPSLCCFAVSILASPLALATVEEVTEQHHFDKMFFYSVINFVTLILVLGFLLRKPIQEFFRKRSSDTQSQMEQTKKFYEEAAKHYQTVTTQLGQASLEAKNLIESIKKDGEIEKQRLIDSAKEHAQKIKDDAAIMVQQELKRAQEILRAETVNLATEIATRHIKDTITAEDRDTLNAEFITAAAHFEKGIA